MKVIHALLIAAAVSFVLFITTHSASAETKKSMHTYAQAVPPVGWIQFCDDNPLDCSPTEGTASKITMTTERLDTFNQVNSFVNEKVKPVSDKDLYGKDEHWTYPEDAGDCEDYVLLKRRYLMDNGFSPNMLLITVVLDENHEGHAVLTVVTANGDYVFDNRRDTILPWTDTGYIFIKRQSRQNPMIWWSLTPPTKPVATATFN